LASTPSPCDLWNQQLCLPLRQDDGDVCIEHISWIIDIERGSAPG
jgi:hypothetical protein